MVFSVAQQEIQLSRVPPMSDDAETRLQGFIDKCDPKHRTLIRAVRRKLRKRFPTATEMVYDNYNFFVIGYSPTERPSDAVFSIAAGANGVSICFLYGARLADPKKLLSGGGKQTRFLRVTQAADLNRAPVRSLMKAALD